MNQALSMASRSGALVTDPTWIFFLVLVIILFAPLLLRRIHVYGIVWATPIADTVCCVMANRYLIKPMMPRSMPGK